MNIKKFLFLIFGVATLLLPTSSSFGKAAAIDFMIAFNTHEKKMRGSSND